MRLDKFLISVLASLALLMITITPTQALEISDLDNPKIIEAFVDGLVIPLMKENHSPSGAVAIVKDGKLIFSKGYGFQNIEKRIKTNPETTLFRPGSVSKLFTWVSVMQMVEQGKLDLDTDVNTYLTQFQIKDTFPGDPVTMRDIMTHSAGFEDGGMGYLIIEDIEKTMPLATAMEKYQPERINPPGAQTAYSNYATSIAGLIVANLSGMDFTDYVQKNIFDVLGMKSSSFYEPLPEPLLDNMAVAYAYDGARYTEKPFEIIANFAPAGSQSASATDMVIFTQAILNGGIYEGNRILKTETVTNMLTRNFSHDDRMMGMALGFYETEENGVRLVGHGGDTAYFHSDLGIDLEHNVGFFVSFSSTGGGAVRSAFAPAFYKAFMPTDVPYITPPEDFSERAGKYAGEYSFWRASFTKFEKVSGIVGGIAVAPTADNTLIVSMGNFGGEYVEIDTNLFRKIDGFEKIGFQENSAGDITGFVMDGLPFMSTYKLPIYKTGGFNIMLIGFSLLMFVGVILRRLYQRQPYKALAGIEKSAARASVLAAGLNLATVIVGAIVLLAVADRLMAEVPTALTLWLWLPIIATAAGFYHLYNTVLVWHNGLCGGIWARIRYSFVAAGSLFFCWVYYFWNILGFNYFA